MKKYLHVMAFAIIVLIFTTSTRSYAGFNATTDTTTCTNTERMGQIKNRLEEINAVDKSALTHEERRALRHEAKAMRAEVESVKAHRAMYVSVGGVLLVVLVLIFVL